MRSLFRAAGVLLLLTCILQSYAQYQEHRGIVHYVDGSVFMGEILQINQSTVRMKLSTGDTISVAQSHIKKLLLANQVMVYDNGRFHYLKGLYSSLYMNVGLAYETSVQLGVLLAYRFREKWAAGAGIEFDNHDTYAAGLYYWHQFFAGYGYGRYYFNERKKRLYADLKLGYGFPIVDTFTDPHSGGIMAQPGIGIIFPTRGMARLSIGLSHITQFTQGKGMDFDPLNQPIITDYKIWYNRVVLNLSMELY